MVSSKEHLESLMGSYVTDFLVEISAVDFESRIRRYLEQVDHEMEGYEDPEKQRDLSIRFHWGHDHDFGQFFVKGRMGKRHISLLASFMEDFQALPVDLSGTEILDIGCWTGGTSLLLAALGAEVVAIEEVKKYAQAAQYLKDAFAVENLEVQHRSLYDCVTPDYQDRFDYVLFAGVLYHLTDPILALRIVFNSLKDNGKCLLETYAIDSTEPVLRYEGPTVTAGGSREELSRSGWNWFVPSKVALENMLLDVGFSKVDVGEYVHDRLLAVGERSRHVDLLRAGFSHPSVR